MTDDLVRQLREVGGLDPAAELCSYAADYIEQLEKALKFLIECESWTKLAAEAEGKPYTNLGLQWARQILEGKDDE